MKSLQQLLLKPLDADRNKYHSDNHRVVWRDTFAALPQLTGITLY